jgi:hypothetical protein
MSEEQRESRPGLIVRLLANILTFTLVFGLLRPFAQRIFGDSKGLVTDLKDGLVLGAICGVLMTFLGDPLSRWLDRVLHRKRV